jgi:dihydrofolate reductase
MNAQQRRTGCRVNLIVAYDENRVLSNQGTLPWRISVDTEQLKRRTMMHPVIMGRKTYMSIPKMSRPLDKRYNIVLSEAYGHADLGRNIAIATNIKKAIQLATAFNFAVSKTDIWIVGGATVYREALGEGVVDHVIATEVRGRHQGDAFFPELPIDEWDRQVVCAGEEYDMYEYSARS